MSVTIMSKRMLLEHHMPARVETAVLELIPI